MLESYKYLGAINRQISILLDLNKNKGKRNNSEIIGYIIDSAINLSQAKVINLYKYNLDRKYFNLLSSSRKEETGHKIISLGKYAVLDSLAKNCCRVQGTKEDHIAQEITSQNDIKYFLFLPLSVDHSTKGAIFLGFDDREFVTTQELDFYEAFAAQASFILQNLGIWK